MPTYIDLFRARMAGTDAPSQFVDWVAIASVAGVIGRKVWTTGLKGAVYPNIFVCLVAEAAMGKTTTLGPAYEILSEVLEENQICPDAITPQSFLERMSMAAQKYKHEGKERVYSNYLVINDELRAMFAVRNQSELSQFQAQIAAIWDNSRKKYEYKTKHKEHDAIENPGLSICAGIQPVALPDIFTAEAMKHGFGSRFLFVYNDVELPRGRLFSRNFSETDKSAETKACIKELTRINKMVGALIPSDDFIDRANDWDINRGPGVQDAQFSQYNKRRSLWAIKLSVISAAMHKRKGIVTGADFDNAISWMTELEPSMPKAFAQLGDYQLRALEETYEWFRREVKNLPLKQIPHEKIYDHIGVTFRKLTPYQAETVYRALYRRGLLIREVGDSSTEYLRWPEDKPI